jgi:hypothetical protein
MSVITNPGQGGATGPYTVATLPPSPHVGQVAFVTDGAAGQTWASTVVGGGHSSYMVWFNGLNWTVVGDGGYTYPTSRPTYPIYGF